MERKLNIYVIGDTHFMHDNIIKYCERPFLPSEQDGIMISRWNNTVTIDDLVIHMGDFALHKNSEKAAWIINALKGRKILVKGNHDRKTDHWYLTHGFDFVCNSFVLDDILFTHRPIENLKKWKFNIHGHIHQKKLEKYSDLRYINVCVEVIDYKPIKLETIIGKRIQEMKNDPRRIIEKT